MKFFLMILIGFGFTAVASAQVEVKISDTYLDHLFGDKFTLQQELDKSNEAGKQACADAKQGGTMDQAYCNRKVADCYILTRKLGIRNKILDVVRSVKMKGFFQEPLKALSLFAEAEKTFYPYMKSHCTSKILAYFDGQDWITHATNQIGSCFIEMTQERHKHVLGMAEDVTQGDFGNPTNLVKECSVKLTQ